MKPTDAQKLLADVEAYCQELRPIEELCYVEHRFNDQVIALARKYNLLGMPVPETFGGRGADTVTYARALTRIGRESVESQVVRTYLETVAELPWDTRSDEHLDVKDASKILDEDRGR